jgi:branched-chain amino acid transport system permease protein
VGLLILVYLLGPLLQGLLNGVINSAFPISPEIAAEQEITLRSEMAVPVSRIQFMVVVSSLLMMAALYSFIQRTKIGKAMRAVAEDKDVAALMGIDVDRVITITFALGAIMAGAAGVLYGLMFRQVNFFMGFFPGLKAFTAAVLGGIGNVPGAMMGGFFLGIFESLGPSLFLEGLGIAAPYQLKDAIAFTMLVLVLIFRPAGIMGVDLGKKKA